MAETPAISSSPPPSDEGPSTSADSPAIFSGDSPENSGEEVEEEEEEEEEEQIPVILRQQTSTSYRVGYAPRRMAGSEELRADDTWSCVIVVLTFWFFVSMTLIMGIFGSEDLQLGPYSSILLKPNPLFVQYLRVTRETDTDDELKDYPVLYAFYKAPPLDVAKTWSESLIASIRADSHKEWVYYLNEGSQINISYNVSSSSPLVLIIAKGIEGMAEWLEDPSYPGNAMSWNVIHGTGTVTQDISKSYDYYVAVGNFNSENVEVKVDISVRSSMHNIRDSYYKCNLAQGSCSLKILFPGGNAAVLTTEGSLEGIGSKRLYVKMSYEPRWMTYFLGIGGMTSVMLWAFNFLNRFRRNYEDAGENEAVETRAPLLYQKDDDMSSLGSSYDSGSQNDDSPEYLEEGLPEGKSIGESGRKYSSRQLCVICFDAPKDCFFIPCGHCASCFTCGTRIAEASGICPICRRKMKKVRRIYNV